MSTDKITNDKPVPPTEVQPAAPRLVQRFIGGFGPSPEQGRAWREAAIKRRLERETASGANNSTELTVELGAGNSDNQADQNVRVAQ